MIPRAGPGRGGTRSGAWSGIGAGRFHAETDFFGDLRPGRCAACRQGRWRLV